MPIQDWLSLSVAALCVVGCAQSEAERDAPSGGPAPSTLVAGESSGDVAVAFKQNAEGDTQEIALPPPELALAVGSGRRDVRVGRVTRSYILHVGAKVEPGAPVPLVFVHHGFTMSAQVMTELTTWKAIADREGLLVAFADGNMDLGPLSSPWNVGFPVCGVGSFVANTGQDDLGFVEAMLDDVETVHAIDQARIYITGFSMGGFFTNQAGCQRSGLFAGIAPHSGGSSLDGCPRYQPLPVLVLHGDADPLIDYGCGVDARDRWLRRNGCSNRVEQTVKVEGGSCDFYAGCKAAVGLCTFSGMGHGWAGADGLGLPFDYAGGTNYADAAELTWKFWSEHT